MMIKPNIMRSLRVAFLVISVSLLASTASLACDTTIILAEAEFVTLDDAVNRVKKNKKGKVLGAETVEIDGHPIHVIKVLTKGGLVKKIRINTRSNQQ